MSSDHSDDEKTRSNPEEPSRRKTVRRMLVGGGIISAGSQAPREWTRPLVNSVVMPAHAQGSPPDLTAAPTVAPTNGPTARQTNGPTAAPTDTPTAAPTED